MIFEFFTHCVVAALHTPTLSRPNFSLVSKTGQSSKSTQIPATVTTANTGHAGLPFITAGSLC